MSADVLAHRLNEPHQNAGVFDRDLLERELPNAMREACRWLVWRLVPQPGRKPRKVPHYVDGSPRSGNLDGPEDVARLATFEDACKAMAGGRYAGLGFALGQDRDGRHWQGIDLDGLSDRPELAILGDDLPGYVERSPSGDGLHAVGIGKPFAALASNASGIESYCAGRYFTVTGDAVGLGDLEDLSGFVERELRPRHRAAAQRKTPERREAPPLPAVDNVIRDLRSALAAMPADDYETWISTGQALHELGDAGRQLWLEWSQTSEKWQPADADRWDTFSAERTGYAAVFARAARYGWQNPRRSTAGQGEASSPAHRGGQALLEQQHQQGDAPEPACPWESPMPLRDVLHTDPPPIRWLVRDRIQLGRGALVTGIGGSSKTRLLVHLAVGVATGRLSWGWEVESTGKAVLILTEDVPEDAHRALWATCQGLGLDDHALAAVEQKVIAYPLAGTEVKLLVRHDGMVRTALFDRLVEQIKGMGEVRLIGIDPALSVTTGDEADQSHQRALGRMADDLAVLTGATVMIAAHAAKGSQGAAELGSHTSRGGGAVTDAVRMEFAMRTMTAAEAKEHGVDDLEERRRHVQLVATKGNHLPPDAFVPIWLRRGEHGALFAADLAYQAPGHDESATGPQARDLRALEVLRELAQQHVPTLSEWRDACQARGLLNASSAESAARVMRRIKNRLLEHRLIEPGMGKDRYTPCPEVTP